MLESPIGVNDEGRCCTTQKTDEFWLCFGKRPPRWQSKCSWNLSHGVEVEREAAACGAYFYVNMQTGRVVKRNRPKDPYTRNTYHELKLISVDSFNLHFQPT